MMSLYRLEKYAAGDGDPIDTSDALSVLAEVNKLRRENSELKMLLEGANVIHDRISELVGYRGQYRDLVEAVEIKLHEKL